MCPSQHSFDSIICRFLSKHDFIDESEKYSDDSCYSLESHTG